MFRFITIHIAVQFFFYFFFMGFADCDTSISEVLKLLFNYYYLKKKCILVHGMSAIMC